MRSCVSRAYIHPNLPVRILKVTKELKQFFHLVCKFLILNLLLPKLPLPLQQTSIHLAKMMININALVHSSCLRKTEKENNFKMTKSIIFRYEKSFPLFRFGKKIHVKSCILKRLRTFVTMAPLISVMANTFVSFLGEPNLTKLTMTITRVVVAVVLKFKKNRKVG